LGGEKKGGKKGPHPTLQGRKKGEEKRTLPSQGGGKKKKKGGPEKGKEEVKKAI